jgi:hypothetical protein
MLRIPDFWLTKGAGANNTGFSAYWLGAPAWHALLSGAGLLISLAGCTGVLPGQPDAATNVQSATAAATPPETCMPQVPAEAVVVTGRVTGFLSDEEALAATRKVEAQLGGKVSPAYLHLKRVTMVVYSPTGDFLSMAAVPDSMKVRVGSLVDVNARRRDPALPCNFIPWVITHVADHAG